MEFRMGTLYLITLSVIAAAGMVHANTQQSGAVGQPATTSQSAKADKKGKNIKAVDINSASKAELKTLPGIDGALADKIIAGRPFLSKAFLVTRNIIPMRVYEQIDKQIIAMQK